MYEKKFSIIFIFIIFCSTFADQNQLPSIYKQIQPINLASLTWEDEEWPNESFQDYLYRCLNYQMNPQELKKRRIVFNLFDELSSQKSAEHNVLYDMITAQDLNLLAGKKESESYVAEIIDKTKTEFGRVFLYALLSNPTTDIAMLQSRQEIIKYVINDADFHSQLNKIYGEFALSENMLLSLWAQDGFLYSTQRHYFSYPFMQRFNEKLNCSPLALQLRSLLYHNQRGLFLATGVFAAVILPIYGLSKATDIPLPELLQRFAQYLQGSGGQMLALISSMSDHKLVATSTIVAAGITCALACKEDYEWARDNVILDNCLQQKMILIANFFNNITKLAKLLESHPHFIAICPAAAYINRFMHENFNSSKMQELFRLFTSPTLTGEPSFFSFHGRTLAAFKLIYDVKETIAPLLMALGELDAYCSCACLYNEFNDKKVTFCFTKYKRDIHPSIKLEEFWNPFINPDKVISNSMNIQGPNRRNIIITGPNAGGKSTLIKAIPINLILSQSIGLTAAKSAEITPFYSIATYLNIVDDIAAGNSLFKAQVLRAQEMVNLVEQTPYTAFSFIALDEMFNGTSAKESMAVAYSVVKHIGKFSNNISIIATHFPLLTNLEYESPAFANYKVSVEVDDYYGIRYPFKLEKGSSHQHVALDILRQEGYDCTIIEEATEILKTVTI